MSASYVFAVQATNFQTAVLQKSAEVPVLLDFWADWCGPCKTLGPTLEALAAAYGGAFLLGKVDTESEVELAQAFQVQSIPFLVLMQAGRPADAAQGALPEPELREFLARNGIQPSGEGRGDEPDEDPDAEAARLDEAKRAAAAGEAAAARSILEGLPEEGGLLAERADLEVGLGFLEADIGSDAEARQALILARQELLAGHWEAALEALLTAAALDREGHALVQQAMRLCQALLGADSALVLEYRRRLATLLYS